MLPKYECFICHKKKVGIIAKWFGLNHCEDCDIKIKLLKNDG